MFLRQEFIVVVVVTLTSDLRLWQRLSASRPPGVGGNDVGSMFIAVDNIAAYPGGPSAGALRAYFNIRNSMPNFILRSIWYESK